MSDCFEIFAAFFSSWAYVITIWAYFNGKKNNFLDLIITEKKIENMIWTAQKTRHINPLYIKKMIIWGTRILLFLC